ncbi:MAG TPA: hypothetical protein VHC22_02170 [Pirellulales bacterium]|nr:hypothetical protein [Pirellulales bacterium]
MRRSGSLALVSACAVLLTSAFSQASEPKAADAAKDVTVVRFDDETTVEAPRSFVPVVGNWRLAKDEDNRVFMVDGSQWSRGQTAAGIADRARALYGERYAEFLDNVKAFAYFPYAVATSCEDFEQGEITMRFKTIAGKIDQGAGILFNLKPNGDYLALRANPLENNLVLWKFERGVRTSVEWVKEAPATSQEWHELKLVVAGKDVKGYIDGKHLLTHTLPTAVSGRIGIWSKADSVVYFDDYTVHPAAR